MNGQEYPAKAPFLNARELLALGSRRLLEADGVTGDAALEARELLFSVLGWTLSDYALKREEPVEAGKAALFLQRIERRTKGEPLQYITGLAPFFGYDFLVDSRVLIPRFDTEVLVEAALSRLAPGMRVLDICTGSGCVPITLALEARRRGHSFLSIEGSDISEDALALARENAARHDVKIRFFQSDLLETAGREYGIITANPPYITQEEMGELDREVRDYEPHLALFGGEDGLAFYRRIALKAPAHLANAGWLLLEIGAAQAKSVREILEEASFVVEEILKDLGGRDRVVVARWERCNLL